MKPILGITMGDAIWKWSGDFCKSINEPETYEVCRPLIVGDAKCMEAAIPTSRVLRAKINVIHGVKEAKFEPGIIDVYDLDVVDLSKRLYKKDRKKLAEIMQADVLDAAYKESMTMCGEAAFQYVKKAIELAMAGEVDATVTNALNKDHINMAGSSLLRTYRNICRLYTYSKILHDACT